MRGWTLSKEDVDERGRAEEMSGGDKEEGGKAVLSGENTSGSSYHGSEPHSEISLPSTSAGPTISFSPGKRLEQGKEGESYDLKDQSSQQLKFYGRRNRAKHGNSRQFVEGGNDRAHVEAASPTGRLAIDLTGQLESGRGHPETGVEETLGSPIDYRNGSSVYLSPDVPCTRQGSVSSSDVIMGQEPVESVGLTGIGAGVEIGKNAEEVGEAKILDEINLVQESSGFSRLDDRDDKRKNGVLDPEGISEVLKGTGEVRASCLSLEKNLLERGQTIPKDAAIISEVGTVTASPVLQHGSRKESAGSSSCSLSADHLTVEGGEVKGEVTRGDHDSVGKDTIVWVEGSQEVPVRRSTTTAVKIICSSSNGDRHRHLEKGTGRNLARNRKSRAHLFKEDAGKGDNEMSHVVEDQEISRVPLQMRLALERLQYEDSVLAKADDIHSKQEILDSTKKIPLKGKEPARCKTHWDFVLEEMVWLSKDFEKERKWKLSQAKKVALRVSRSKLDVEAKGVRRQKEEEQRTRRVASNIAKDVKKFWMKVEKLVTYKHQLELEERRKKALDKHLDFLLGQTERYSTMLAENLADIVVTVVPKALPSIPGEGIIAASKAETVSVEEQKLCGNLVPPSENLDGGVLKDDSCLENGMLKDVKEMVRRADDDAGDEDFDLYNEVEEEDDETTIAADEALITEEEKREELSTLQRESELPLEELLKLYGKNGDESDGVDDDNGDTGDDEEREEEKGLTKVEGPVNDQFHTTTITLESPSQGRVGKFVENGTFVAKNRVQHLQTLEASSHHDVVAGIPETLSGVATHPVVDLPAVPEVVLKKVLKDLTCTPVPAEAVLPNEGTNVCGDVGTTTIQLLSEDIIDDGEYIPATLDDGIEEDDEATLDEEDRLATTDAYDPAAEVDLLKRESEMSVDELLAQYKLMAAADYAESSDEDGEVFIEDRHDRTSEAGTSGSNEKAGDRGDGMDVDGNMVVAKERMGEPSTSGREQWALVSSGFGRKPKKRAMDRKTHFESNGNISDGDMKVTRRSTQEDVAIIGNGDLRMKDLSGEPVVSFLLQADEVVDPETMAAVARVSEAAKRRGERILKRASGREQVGPSKFLVSLSSDDEAGAAASGQVYVDLKLVDTDRKVSAESLANNNDGAKILETADGKTKQDQLADAAAEAQSAQPTGYTFLTTKVRTKLPFLLKHSLREYQHIGLDWLVTMYEKRLNGILADEMGLGKTIMTIALLAHLACDRGIWGPHLIVVPTSVMLNWETEFMKWCPAFKILTYFGSAKERKYKRQGWSKPNNFHVCITTYRLVIQDAKAFKRKKWKYLILDEAHLIKNWKSQRWQTLLNFNSKRRILLTGTPLQNDLMELWSLMHFLMPHVFQSHQEFRDWFSNPITGMVEGQEQINKEVVDRLHNVLRPFLLRRLKQDVEKQLPGKFEHVLRCRLSKRQRNLYEDFMANSDTQATLSSGNFLGLLNVLMQLRKVCNHPDLFEGRPIISSFDMPGLSLYLSSLACSTLHSAPFAAVNLSELNLLLSQFEYEMTTWECEEVTEMCTPVSLIEELSSTGEDSWGSFAGSKESSGYKNGLIEELQATLRAKRARERKQKLCALAWLNLLRCSRKPLYGLDLRKCVAVEDPVHDVHKVESDTHRFLDFSSVIADIVKLPLTRLEMSMGLVESFVFAIPAARAPAPSAWCSHLTAPNVLMPVSTGDDLEDVSTLLEPLRPVFVRRQLFFPDRRLLQFDCGKLQQLDILLRRLKSEGHRALIFTQMTKMLDILEGFISLYGYTYMRLDGSTKPEQRQILMQRFNTNPKIFLFILSTRSGGVGINLVGADTVIFYDSDWNPAMDQQAQDRCHRIGQTREVHIYRLVSESTIEENILKKANQKRILDDLVIQSGSYNTEFFKKLDPMELFSGLKGVQSVHSSKGAGIPLSETLGAVRASDHELSSAEVEAALKNAEDEADYMAMKRVEQEEAAENQEFTEEAFAGNMDDEEYPDEMEEGRTGVGKNPADGVGGIVKDIAEGSNKAAASEEVPQISTALIPADAEEEMDMLADVKQMAAVAAASGRGSISFEDQLRPVERYAMRFLELWDPRVDRASEAAQVQFEEKEWELDQLEKLKEEQEAEIDEDNEPLFYESWDTAFANEAYRQQVEVLAQQQENQRQLEWEAMEEEMRDADRAVVEASSVVIGAENFKVKSKSLKKLQKAKFKSLKRSSLGSEVLMSIKSGGHKDGAYGDGQFEMSARSPSQRKRKAPELLEEEMQIEEFGRRMKKDHVKFRILSERGMYSRKLSEIDEFCDASDDEWAEADLESGDLTVKSPSSSGAKKKEGGKISIMGWPVRKGPLMTLEKERKRDSGKMQEHVPNADPWALAEDAVLCAVVHEYGGNWQLASDVLSGMSDGSKYRGRHRHPFHCRERFRQLLAQNSGSTVGDPSSERNSLYAASNFKVTEEHTKKLLEVLVQQSEKELLLRRHFASILAAVQNKVVRKAAGIEKPGASAGNGVSPTDGGGFISLLKLVRPQLSLNATTSQKISFEIPTVERTLSIAKALHDSESPEEPRAVKESINLQAEKESHGGTQSEDEAISILEYLELDPCSESASVHYAPVMLSAEELLGYELPGPPSPPPATALRISAEDCADQRFRLAMNNGWGVGLYEWAASATSGLGSSGISKGKSKKRPPPTDVNKPPKPKQPRISKASKKDSEGTSVPVSTPLSSKKRKNVRSATLPSPVDGVGNSVSDGGPQLVSTVNNPSMVAAAVERLQHITPEDKKSSETAVVSAALGLKIESKKGSSRQMSSTSVIKSTKLKPPKPKDGTPLPGIVLMKGATGQSVAAGSPTNLEAISARLALEMTPMVILPTGSASDLDDCTSGSDDEVVITGVSLPSASWADISHQFSSGTSFSQGGRGPKSATDRSSK